MGIKSMFRHSAHTLVQRFPQLRKLEGRIGLGRWLTPNNTIEHVILDSDIVVELDLSVPYFRYLYFHHDLSNELESVLIRQLLGPAQVFVDVGAHIGYFALLAAKYAQHVYAFEPSSNTYAYLRRNTSINSKLTDKMDCYMMALSDTPGTLTLYSSRSEPSLASLQPINTADGIREVVSVDTLDHVLADIPIAFLKIDVEGAEMNVLMGARRHIAENRPIVVCELFEAFQQRFGHSCQDISDFFTNQAYQGFRVESISSRRDAITLMPLDLNALSTTEVNDALFVPSDQTTTILARLSA